MDTDFEYDDKVKSKSVAWGVEDKNVGGCTYGFVTLLVLGFGFWLLSKSYNNRRDYEIEEYLKSIDAWNDFYS